MGPLLPLNNYFTQPSPQCKHPEASNNLINRFVITFRDISVINMKRPDLCFISQMQSLWHNPASLKWQTSLPAFIDHWKIAELSLSSKVGEERADSTLWCIWQQTLFSTSLLWEPRAMCWLSSGRRCWDSEDLLVLVCLPPGRRCLSNCRQASCLLLHVAALLTLLSVHLCLISCTRDVLLFTYSNPTCTTASASKTLVN